MKLTELLDENMMSLSLADGNKFEAIEQLLSIAVEQGHILDREKALQDLIEREQYLSTGFENGLAVPHAKSDAVDHIVMIYGLHREGIDFDSLDGQPTHSIFLLLSPMDTSGPHIQTLALIARNFQDDTFSEQLKKAESAEAVMDIFANFK